MDHARAINWSDLNPHAFMYGSLPFYSAKLTTVAASFFFGASDSAQSNFYLAARWVSVLLGATTILLVFLFGKLIANEFVGLLSAAIFALSPLAVVISHYATVDAMLGFWCALSLVGMALWLNDAPRGMYLCGIAMGLAMATKYNAAILLLPVFLIAAQSEWRKWLQPISPIKKFAFISIALLTILVFIAIFFTQNFLLALVTRWTTRGELQPVYFSIFKQMMLAGAVVALAALVITIGVIMNWNWANRIVSFLTSKSLLKPVALTGIVFALVSPFVILDFPSFARDFFFQVNKNISGGIVGYASQSRSYEALLGDSSAWNPLQYIQAIQDEFGIIIFVSIFLGLVALWRRDRRTFIAFGSLVILMLLGTATWRYQATRYLFPLWTLFALFAALGIESLARFVISRVPNLWLGRAIAACLIVLALQSPLRASLDEVRNNFLMPDTRNQALNWVESNVPRGSFILSEWGAPEIARVDSNYRVHFTGFPFEEASLADWEKQGVTVVMISTERYVFYRAHASAFQDVLTEYDRLKEKKLVQSFEPHADLKGPAIYIYAIP